MQSGPSPFQTTALNASGAEPQDGKSFESHGFADFKRAVACPPLLPSPLVLSKNGLKAMTMSSSLQTQTLPHRNPPLDL